MNNPTKTKCQELIEKLANKELSFGCVVETDQYKHMKGEMVLISDDYKTKQGDWRVLMNGSLFYQNEKDMNVIGHKVMIGYCLEKIYELWEKGKGFRVHAEVNELIFIWKECGLTKSLNEILENAEVEEIHAGCLCKTEKIKERLKDPNIANLFSFLIEIFK